MNPWLTFFLGTLFGIGIWALAAPLEVYARKIIAAVVWRVAYLHCLGRRTTRKSLDMNCRSHSHLHIFKQPAIFLIARPS